MSEDTRSVSVIIAAFNAAAFLENCLLSVFSQTHPQVEVVVVDGGSTDGTLAILQKYGHVKSLKWTSEKDNGLNDAQWKGVARAGGGWVYFLGADDVLARPKALEELFAACPSDISIYDILTGRALYEDGRLYKSNRPGLLRLKNCIHGQGALYRRSLFQQKTYDFNLKVYYDYEFNLWALKSGKKFFHTNVLLSVLGSGGHSDKPKWKNYREDMRVRSRYVHGVLLVATNIAAVCRYLYKKMWFSLLRSI